MAGHLSPRFIGSVPKGDQDRLRDAMSRGANAVYEVLASQGKLGAPIERAYALVNPGKPPRKPLTKNEFEKFLAKNPIFAVHKHYEYTQGRIHLTFEGFLLWIMGQNTPTARALKGKFAEELVRKSAPHDPEISSGLCTPTKARKADAHPLRFTPIACKIADSVAELVSGTPSLQKQFETHEATRCEGKGVYFICEGGLPDGTDLNKTRPFKVGMTSRGPKKRMSQLQTGNSANLHVYKFFPTDKPRYVESKLHHEIGKKRKIRSEWFNISAKEVDDIICDLKKTKT